VLEIKEGKKKEEEEKGELESRRGERDEQEQERRVRRSSQSWLYKPKTRSGELLQTNSRQIE
jgi:hypothetical protein